MHKQRSIDTLPIDGGVLCLNFVNTVYAWKGENLHEYFQSYNDVLRWCKKLDILSKQELDQLAGQYKKDEERGDEGLVTIKKIRLVLHHVFSAIAEGTAENIEKEVLNDFNLYMSAALSSVRYFVANGKLSYDLSIISEPLLKPVLPVLVSAHEVIKSDLRKYIKECPACGWLFLDTTKNKRRKWCNPQSCGSIDKSRRYYNKHKNKD